MLYVVEGRVALKTAQIRQQVLTVGGFAFIPPGEDVGIQSQVESRLLVFEKRYVPLGAAHWPHALFGQEQDIPGVPFLGDPDALLKTLLPADATFDLAVNIFTYQPGATLPMVEVHVMEHGLLMLEGQGIYRLGDDWYPVQKGDVIWMAAYCPQWFVAMGKQPARYLYYKDVNRHPLEGQP
jgi:(S)-ureidoglycine aminohydrolase